MIYDPFPVKQCSSCQMVLPVIAFYRDPLEWLTDRFGPRKAKQILKRIEEYFAWVREQDAKE